MFNDLSYKTLLPSKKPKSISNVEVKDENGLMENEEKKLEQKLRSCFGQIIPGTL